jgi:folylpolyglutamate synthase/dihydropteroate synthase
VASARSLAAVLGQEEGDVHLVLSISADKHVETLLGILLAVASKVTVTQADASRSLRAEVLADLVRSRAATLPVFVDAVAESALRAAQAELSPGGVLCAAGSVYLAGIARRVLAPK